MIVMRSPEEGPRTGASPGTGVHASGQWLEELVQERTPSHRAQPVKRTLNRTRSTRNHNGNAAPANDAAIGRRQSLTLTGRQRQRIMWTREMNEFVIRCYYVCTRLETDMSGRPRMLEMFNEQFPRFAGQLDRNKLYTRRRAILSHNMLSPAEIEAIKLEVQRELRRESGRSSDMSRRSSARLSASFASERRESIAPPPDPVDEPREQEPAEDQQRGQLKNELAFHMDAAVTQFYGTDPLTRHKIPKLQYSHRLTSAVQVLDQEVLPVYLKVVENLEELQFIVYCGTVAVVRTLGMRTFHQDDRQNRVLSKKPKPAWMRRLEGRIQTLRVKIGRLTQYKRGSRSRKLIRGVAEIVKPAELSDLNENRIIEILYTHVQRLSAFYSRIKKKRNNYDGGLPEIDEVTQFWSGLWENPIKHRSNRMWLAEEEEYGNGPEAIMVTAHDINEAIRYSRNWAAPGPDFVHNFW
ncbi:uncharacterized protein LOC129761439 [Toxorhynchites rutilus septentrionalis]|uniref:uncharacterized protein LOC129761439 n=1 Tax=Toxorhynchites rutilus septentrionalis TaxID=329112 RepID=UPI00247A9901|nr:uncharacterized protein LOC129761439 [Toxorhynchites rutilus septentrionalis]